MRHWFAHRRWPQLIVALVVTACTLIFASPGGALAAPAAGTLYTDAKLGFTMRLSNGWAAVPHQGTKPTADVSAVEFTGPASRVGFAIVVQHGPDMPATFASKSKPTGYIGSYPAIVTEYPAVTQSPVACSERTFLAGLDYVDAQWCGGQSQASQAAIQHILATYKPASASFKPSPQIQPNLVVNPPSCLQLQRNNFHNPTGTYNWGAQLGTPTSTSPANGWYQYNPGTYLCSNKGSPDGWLFQCTDLANRFVREQWGLGTLYEDGDSTFNNYLHGNAGTYFDYWNSSPIAGSAHNLSDAHLFADARWLSDYQQAFPSYNYVSSLPPQPGDLLIWQDVNNASLGPKSGFNPAARTGHVAVVTGTDAHYVYVAQQNMIWSNGTEWQFQAIPYQSYSGGWAIDPNNINGVVGRVVVGWIHFSENANTGAATQPLAGSWNGQGAGVGYYNQSNSTFYLRDSLTTGSPNRVLNFGIPGDRPVVGQWLNNGVDYIGLWRPSNATFYLATANTSPVTASISFVFGTPNTNWIPIAGVWTQGGQVGIGLYDPTHAVFHLRNSLTSGPDDTTINYGAANDMPVVGDWNNDGRTTIGVYRPSQAKFYLSDQTSSPPTANYTVNFGLANWQPFIGDWQGNGSRVGVFDWSSGNFYLRYTLTTGSADVTLQLTGCTSCS